MTRLTQALERARLAQDLSPCDDPTGSTSSTRMNLLGELGPVAEAAQRSVRLPAVAGTEATKDESAATRMTPSTRCPRCERVQLVRADVPGFWERRVLSLVRIRPYRCVVCDHRFRRFNV